MNPTTIIATLTATTTQNHGVGGPGSVLPEAVRWRACRFRATDDQMSSSAATTRRTMLTGVIYFLRLHRATAATATTSMNAISKNHDNGEPSKPYIGPP